MTCLDGIRKMSSHSILGCDKSGENDHLIDDVLSMLEMAEEFELNLILVGILYNNLLLQLLNGM